MSKKIFCSLDIEGTGLDPAKDHIIEVGAVLFELDKNGEIKFGEKFSQLVKSPIPIPPFIQDLTNIREADLADAPEWEVVRPKFEKFIGEYPIVGQNVQFDISFLSARGMKFAVPVIDTKELAQIFLPQARFFNLEYLLRYFNVPLESHHRAAADARSTALLLREIVLSARKLPQLTQKAIAKLLKASDLSYKDLFRPGVPPTESAASGRQGQLFMSAVEVKKLSTISEKPTDFKQIFSASGTFLVNTPSVLWQDRTVESLIIEAGSANSGVVLSVDTRETFSGVAATAEKNQFVILDEPENYFCPVRFQNLSMGGNFSDALVSFLIKTLVWLAVKKPDENLSALPLFGPDYAFREMICGNFSVCSSHREPCALSLTVSKIDHQARILTTHAAWLKYSAENFKRDFNRLLFWNTASLEKTAEELATQNFTLRSIRTHVTLLYNPADGSGILDAIPTRVKKLFEKILNQMDLDFGLWSINFSEEYPRVSQLVADADFRERDVFSKILASAEKFVTAVEALTNSVKKEFSAKNAEAQRLLKKLDEAKEFLDEFFFNPRSENLYWLDFFDRKLKLKKCPRKISLPKNESKARGFFATLSSNSVKQYFNRLLDSEEVLEIDLSFSKPELEVWLPQDFPRPNYPQASLVVSNAMKALFPKLAGRTVVLFNSQAVLETAYGDLAASGLKPRLIAQKLSGHLWKNLEAYQNSADAIWFATAQNFSKRVHGLPATRQMVVVRIPYEPLGVFESVYDSDSAFSDAVMPRTIIRLDSLWRCFIHSGETGGDNKKIIFLDSRINEGFNEEILSALTSQYSVKFFEFSPDDWKKIKD